MTLFENYHHASILVLGGTGFIGYHLIQRLASLGADITSLGLSVENDISVDVCEHGKIKLALKSKKFNYVFNLSGYIDHSYFLRGGSKIISTHYYALINFLESLDLSKLKSFIQIGSSDEYGSALAPQSESMREAPISPYSAGKVAATHFIQMLSKTENFPGIILRLFLVYGPRQRVKRFLPTLIISCLNGLTFPVSEGNQLRDFCYIDDVVNAMLLAGLSKQAFGEVINIASGLPIKIADVIAKVQVMIGKGHPKFSEIPYRVGENMSLYADINKARKLLNWSPKIKFDEGLKKTIDWYKSRQLAEVFS